MRKALFLLSALYLTAIGVGLVFFPLQLGIGAMPAEASPRLLSLLQLLGGPILGIAALNLLAVRVVPSPTLRAILIANLVGFSAVAAIDVHGLATGEAREIANAFLIVHLGFALAFAAALRLTNEGGQGFTVMEDTPLPNNWPVGLRKAWARTAEFANLMSSTLDGVELPASDRVKAAGAAWWVSLEHHVGIILLVRQERYASAYALLRPLIDSYLRGLWINSSASDEELAGFLDGNDAPESKKLAQRFEAEGIFDADSLSSIQRQMWGAVCDYTHTGSRQIVRHLTGSTIESAHDPEEIVELLDAATAWALMASVGVASSVPDDEKCQQLLDASRRLAAG